MEAFNDARKAGKIRYIGFTGHKDPHVHLHMLEVSRAHGFTFDAVQMPLNVMDAHYRSFEKLVLPELVKQNIGVLGMKSMGSGVILKSNTATAVECLQYALNLPTSVVITGIDSPQILDQAVQTAAGLSNSAASRSLRFSPKRPRRPARGNSSYLRPPLTSTQPRRHPEWLGEELPEPNNLHKDSNVRPTVLLRRCHARRSGGTAAPGTYR